MQEALETYNKLGVVSWPAEASHADCKAILLEDGSEQDAVWGADWDPEAQAITFEALIKILPGQNNPSMEILAAATREAVSGVVRDLLGEA